MTELICRLICKSEPVVKSVAFCGGSAVHMLVGQGRAFCELMPAGRVAGKFGTFDYNSLILHFIHAAVSFKRIQIRHSCLSRLLKVAAQLAWDFVWFVTVLPL